MFHTRWSHKHQENYMSLYGKLPRGSSYKAAEVERKEKGINIGIKYLLGKIL